MRTIGPYRTVFIEGGVAVEHIPTRKLVFHHPDIDRCNEEANRLNREEP